MFNKILYIFSIFIFINLYLMKIAICQNIILNKNENLKYNNNILIISIQKLNFDSNNSYLKTDFNDLNNTYFLNASSVDTNWFITFHNTYDEGISSLDSKKSYVLYVPGDGTSFKSLLDRCFKIRDEYKVNIIAFFWPSKATNLNGYDNFMNSKNNVKKNSSGFKDFLLFFQKYKNKNADLFTKVKSTIFCHSLGNYYIERLVEDSTLKYLDKNLFDNIVLNAAAVNQKDHKYWVEKLNIQKNIFIISNKKDLNLNGVRIISFNKKQLGERTKRHLASNANYINFTNAIGIQKTPGASHSYFLGPIVLENKILFNFYKTIFQGEMPDLTDTQVFQKQKNKLGYFILK